jgi:hypothetical protein
MSYALSHRREDPTVPVILELGGGFFFQTFGVGHIAQGRVATGLTIMFSYWALQFVNALLCIVLIGVITAPLTWLAYMVAAPISAMDPSGR